ncbi:MAG: FKBP-type peptidyl-prolyl cis-trans isomerase [Polyangiaceae bacterium]|nr:FKBP-type peptidyl-prolyl cis-trans isomerase [Polyangiaceae bacterium]
MVLAPGLEILDERIGQGRVARRGDTVAIAYVAVGEDGGEVDSSYAAGETVTFRIGAGRVIPGIERGVVGMREGGQRRLRVAPALAFGDLGHAYGVAPGATVVFVVELVTVE